MDGVNGCFTARHAGGAHDKTIINQIMLRYRPIAPKPPTDGPVSGHSGPAKKESATKKKAKRKYVRVKKNTRSRRCMKNKAKETEEEYWSDGTVGTLQLQPETTIRKQHSPEERSQQQLPSLMCSSLSGKKEMNCLKTSDSTTVTPPPMRVVESWVTLECVTDTCEDDGRLGQCTDRARMKNMEMDTCPGFISNGVDGVQWVNQAYRRMVDPGNGEGQPPEVVVWLGVKEKEKLPVQCPAFACRVRVVYTFGKEKHSQTVPCDVWRMEFGGFAWRLDVQAALSLGR